jgi:hypothetical protein
MPFDLSPKYQPYVPTSDQDVFDYAARHLLAQGVQSRRDDGHSCAYRSPEGLMCAVGVFLADDEVVEGPPASVLVPGSEVLDCRGVPRLAPYVRILDVLQTIHDMYEPSAWRRQLRYAAEAYGLSAAVLEEV